MIFSVEQFLIPLILLAFCILGGAVVFGLYYFLYRRTLKKQGSITSTSFVVKAPLIIGYSHALLAIFILVYVLNQGYFPFMLGGYLFIILFYYILLAIPTSIGSIAITIVNYKKQLISRKRFGLVVLMNIICIILFLMFFYVCLIIIAM